MPPVYCALPSKFYETYKNTESYVNIELSLRLGLYLLIEEIEDLFHFVARCQVLFEFRNLGKSVLTFEKFFSIVNGYIWVVLFNVAQTAGNCREYLFSHFNYEYPFSYKLYSYHNMYRHFLLFYFFGYEFFIWFWIFPLLICVVHIFHPLQWLWTMMYLFWLIIYLSKIIFTNKYFFIHKSVFY